MICSRSFHLLIRVVGLTASAAIISHGPGVEVLAQTTASSPSTAEGELTLFLMDSEIGPLRPARLSELDRMKEPWAQDLASSIHRTLDRVPVGLRTILVEALNRPLRGNINGQLRDVPNGGLSIMLWDDSLREATIDRVKAYLEVSVDQILSVPPISRADARKVVQQFEEVISAIQAEGSRRAWADAETASLVSEIRQGARTYTDRLQFGKVFRPIPDADLASLKRELARGFTDKDPAATLQSLERILANHFGWPKPSTLHDLRSAVGQADARLNKAASEESLIRRRLWTARHAHSSASTQPTSSPADPRPGGASLEP